MTTESVYGKLRVSEYRTARELAAAAADEFVSLITGALDERDTASVILATGNSQLGFLEALRTSSDLDWQRITVFHMDEYLGMDSAHPGSMRSWMQRHLLAYVQPRAFMGIRGEAVDPEKEIAGYTALLEKSNPVICVAGIGENGHLAFNDPPADFGTQLLLHTVELSEESRTQQVGEGHFGTLQETPKRAISLTIHALLRPDHLLVVVPELRKATAVKAALDGPLTPECPASILKTVEHAHLYLDQASASLLAARA